MASIFYLLPFYYLFNRQKSVLWGQVIAGTVSSISMTIVMCLANWLFILPMYIKLLNFNLGMSMTKYVFIGLVPFNLIKGALVTVVFAVLYLRILPWLKQHMKTAI